MTLTTTVEKRICWLNDLIRREEDKAFDAKEDSVKFFHLDRIHNLEQYRRHLQGLEPEAVYPLF